jgi:hypothetical protein
LRSAARPELSASFWAMCLRAPLGKNHQRVPARGRLALRRSPRSRPGRLHPRPAAPTFSELGFHQKRCSRPRVRPEHERSGSPLRTTDNSGRRRRDRFFVRCRRSEARSARVGASAFGRIPSDRERGERRSARRPRAGTLWWFTPDVRVGTSPERTLSALDAQPSASDRRRNEMSSFHFFEARSPRSRSEGIRPEADARPPISAMSVPDC